MAEVRPDRVAIYVRWSTDDQGEGTTLEVQLEGCRHYLLSQGWQYSPHLLFVDDGYSGGSLDRPALSRLRQAVQQGQVDCVVLFKIDRLSRNVVDTVNLVLREWEGRCHVKSAREAIDTASQQGKMFFYTLVSFAEWERSVIKERTWSGRMKRLQEGKNPGFRPPFGLTTGESPGLFAEVPEEATVVRRIFQLYTQGLGYKAIAVQLGQEGLRFRGGRPWSAQSVMAVLQNPIYTGQLVYGRKGSGQSVVVASRHIPPLVAPEQFAVAQAVRGRRAQRRAPNRAVSSDHLLTGLLRCKRCGAAMMGRKRYGAGNHALYYICSGQRNKGTTYCDNGYIRQDALDAWLVESLMGRYAGQPLVAPHRAPEEEAAVTAALAKASRQLQALDRELEVVSRDYRREQLTVEEYREQRAVVERERTLLLDQVSLLNSTLAAFRERERLSRGVLQQISRVQRWEQLSLAERKHLLRELVDRLAVYRAPRGEQVEYDLVWVAGS